MKPTNETYYQCLYELAAILNSARAPEAILQAVVEGVSNAIALENARMYEGVKKNYENAMNVIRNQVA